MKEHESDRASVALRIEHELADVAAAIALVEAGVAETVSLSNLRFGDQVVALLDIAAAERRGIRVESEWWADDAGCGVVVRRIHA